MNTFDMPLSLLNKISYTTIIVILLVFKRGPTNGILVYTAMDHCNSTLNLDTTHGYIRLLNIVYNHTSNGSMETYCRITVSTENYFHIGFQFISSHQLEDCKSNVVIFRKYCHHNTTLQTEITSLDNTLFISFIIKQEEEYLNNNYVNISMLIYAYAGINKFGVCNATIIGTQRCNKSNRCLHESLLEFLDTYTLCNTTTIPPQGDSNDINGLTDDDELDTRNPYQIAVASVIGIILLFVTIIVAVTVISKQHKCQLCLRRCGLVSITNAESLRRNGIPEINTSGNNEPPPNYSDLSFVDEHGEQHNFNPNQSSVSIDRFADVRFGLAGDFQDHSNTSVDRAAGGRSVLVCEGSLNERLALSSRAISTGQMSTGFPPTYSDVVIHQDKYHVHDANHVTWE